MDRAAAWHGHCIVMQDNSRCAALPLTAVLTSACVCCADLNMRSSTSLAGGGAGAVADGGRVQQGGREGCLLAVACSLPRRCATVSITHAGPL